MNIVSVRNERKTALFITKIVKFRKYEQQPSSILPISITTQCLLLAGHCYSNDITLCGHCDSQPKEMRSECCQNEALSSDDRERGCPLGEGGQGTDDDQRTGEKNKRKKNGTVIGNSQKKSSPGFSR
ncbi:hypothetical protein CDAR_484531 [Caerostris darwini]|uniref:Uncharacterized protein n=1 Tax=Caerostris darwini TaxID=1538125 RepID=A0AAV4MJY5_9ARAC|nr:hypothetical protein CDAR_484531 [Caerostris darwini]